MRFSFYTGTQFVWFPPSGVTSQRQVLQLGRTTGDAASVGVYIVDDHKGTAPCPPVSVHIP
jgi:hypothetical protein